MSNVTKQEYETQLMKIHGEKSPTILNTSTSTLHNTHNIHNSQYKQ